MDARNFTFMFYGFLAVWLILVLYVVSLVGRERTIKKQLAQLKSILEERERAK
jgi:CcmD family protein